MSSEASSAQPESSHDEISRAEVEQRLRDHRLTIVDVLPRGSYEAEHIPGALSLPLADIDTHAREVLPDLAAEIAVYCAKFT